MPDDTVFGPRVMGSARLLLSTTLARLNSRGGRLLTLGLLASGCSAPAPTPPPTGPTPLASPSSAPGESPGPAASAAGALASAAASVATPTAPSASIPPVRKAGNLLRVDQPPSTVTNPLVGHRVRSHANGSLGAGELRTWVGPPVPLAVPLVVDDTIELNVLDPQPDGSHLAFYREPYDLQSCKAQVRVSDRTNCRYRAALFRPDGERAWTVSLNSVLSLPEGLEIQDIRLVDGVLYFNEACQDYAFESGSRCSALVALEPATARVLWRTRPLTSSNVFLPLKDHILTGYTLDSGTGRLTLVRRSSGAIVAQLPLPTGHRAFEPLDAARVRVVLDDSKSLVVRVDESKATPRLVQER